MRRSKLRSVIGFLGALIATGALASNVQAADAVSLKGKLVKIIIGSKAGGKVDAMGRMFAKYIPKYVPGAPRAFAQNMPGGGQLRSAQFVQKQKPDGLTIGMFSPRWTTRYLIGEPVKGVDFENTPFIGTYRANHRIYMACLRRDIATSWKGLVKSGKTMISGTSELGGSWDVVWQWLQKEGYPIKVVGGYSGEGELNFAIDRGELNAHPKCQDAESAFPAQYPKWQKNFWAPIFYFGYEKLSKTALATVKQMGFGPPPYLWDIVKKPDPITLASFEVQDVAAAYSSAMFLPPHTPKPIHEMWIKAFNDIAKNKDFNRELSLAFGFPVNAADGHEIRRDYVAYIKKLNDQGVREEVRKRFNALQKSKKRKKRKKRKK